MTNDPHSTFQPPTSFRVVPAAGIDRRACRMLLPDRPGAIGWSPLFVAKDVACGAIVGAAAGMPAPAESGTISLRIAIHVPGPFRRRGVGTALLDQLAIHARVHRCAALVALPQPGERETALAFLLARGFHVIDRMTTFEARVERMAAWLSERRGWLLDRGDIPLSARIVQLPEAPVEQVAALHATAIGGGGPQLEACFRDLARGPDGRDTAVLLVDDVVRGFHQCEFRDDLSTTHALAVADQLRGGGSSSGWAALLLLADRVEECGRRGVVRSRFSCLSHFSSTLRLATVFGAVIVGTREFLCSNLESHP